MPTILLTDRTIASLKPSGAQRDCFDRAFPGYVAVLERLVDDALAAEII